MRSCSARFVATLCAAALAMAAVLVPGAPRAQGTWRAEFAEVCAKTDASLNLTVAELESLIARCEGLAALISAEDEVTKKMFLKRLQRCRDLFAYVLGQLKEEGGAAAQQPAAPEEALPAPQPAPEPPGAATGAEAAQPAPAAQ